MGLSFLKDAGEKINDMREDNANDKLREKVESLDINVERLRVELEGETAKIYGVADTTADAEKAVLTVGNIHGVAAVEDHLEVRNPADASDTYTVQSGDYLSKIAKEVYGDANKYNHIFEANKPMLTDPDKIFPGQVLRIPKLEA